MRYAKFNFVTFRNFLLNLIEEGVIKCPSAWTPTEYINELIENHYPFNISSEDIVLHCNEIIFNELWSQALVFNDVRGLNNELLSSHFHEKESK